MDTKKYLDLVGLGHYDAKIKEYIKTHGSDAIDKLVLLIGASELGDKEKTLIARIAALEAGLGDVSTLEGEVKTAVAAILGEAKRAKDAEAALDARLDIIEGSADTEGSIAKALADAKSYTNTEIGKLDADITSAAVEAGKGIQVQVVEADGKITGVNVTGSFDSKYDAAGAAATVDGKLESYKTSNDAAVAAAKKAGDDAQSDLNAFKGTVSTTYETKADATAKLTAAKGYTDTEIGKVNAKIGTVAEGKTVVGLINEAKQAAIDAATYDDTQVKADIAANASAIATLNGNASTEGSVAKAVADAKSALEAKIKTNTDAIAVLNGAGEGSVSKQVADAVAGIVADAPEAYDTLKEISDWISSHASDASAMNSQINANKEAIAANKKAIDAFTEITEAEIDALFAAK